MGSAALLAAALLADAALGEPRWLYDRVPHPAVLMGRAVGWLDARFNDGARRRARGALAVGALVLGAWLLGRVIEELPFGGLLSALGAAALLAQRSLCDHVADVARALDRSLAEGRQAVAMIVGRDTAEMDGPQVARGAIESAAENLSDGVIAPAFWFLLAGLPGMLVYKVVNTADSMIGYRTPRHEEFGWAAARLDDLLNLAPARLTALLIALLHGVRDWRGIAAEAGRHRSPNAGWPEAALSRALGIALSGPRSYHGTLKHYDFVNPEGRREIGPAEIRAAVTALWRVWAGTLVLVIGVALI